MSNMSGYDLYSGTIKSYNDCFILCFHLSTFTKAEERDEYMDIPNLIDGGKCYDNFDLDPELFYIDAYTVQSPTQARKDCVRYAGRMVN